MPLVTGTSRLPSLSTGDINVTIDPATEVAAVSPSFETISNFSIPAGKAKVLIKNVGPNISGGAVAIITVNGDPVSPGNEWPFEAFSDPSTNEWKTSPAITVVTNGAGVWYKYDE